MISSAHIRDLSIFLGVFIIFRFMIGNGEIQKYCDSINAVSVNPLVATPVVSVNPVTSVVTPVAPVVELPAPSTPPTEAVEQVDSSYQPGDGDYSDWSRYDGGEFVTHLFEPHAETFIKTQKNWVLVMFYIPGCNYSTFAKPQYATAAKTLWMERTSKLPEDWNANIKLTAVNCEINRQVCKRCMNQRITGFPTFLLFKNGVFVEEFKQRRSTQEILKYARDPPSGSWFFNFF